MGYFFLGHKFSIKVNQAFNDIATSYSNQKFNSCRTIYILLIASKDIKTLHTIRLLILQIFNHHCLFYINLLFELNAGIPEFYEAIFSTCDYHNSLKVVTEGVGDFDTVDWRSRMCLFLQDKKLGTTISRNITQTIAINDVRLNRVTQAI